VYHIGQLTHTRESDDAPKPDGSIKNTVRSKILHYPRIYLDHPDPIVFLSLTVNTAHFTEVFTSKTFTSSGFRL
jgi:hypothetical protein